jgi:hypothetical protein
MIVTALILSANILFVHNGEVKVGEVVKRSGSITYVKDCENESAIYRMPVPRGEIVGAYRGTCADFRELKREVDRR